MPLPHGWSFPHTTLDRLAAAPAAATRPGRVARIAALLQSPLERRRPVEMRSRLVATLFGRASNVFMVACAAVVCGFAAWTRGGTWSPAVLAGIEVVLVLVRCGVILAFQRRQRTHVAFDPDPWLVAFGLLAVASSLTWGALCFLALAYARDPVLYLLPVLSTVGTAGAIAARNSGVPRLAKLQLAASLVPVVAGSLLADDRGLWLLLALVPAMAAGLLILIAERHQQFVDLFEMQAELGRLSQTDSLTLLPNRRSLDARLEYAATGERRFALLMIDVDNFKAFNDRFGHPAGDALLRKIATILRQTLRSEGDVVARYGGEEFAVLLESADAADAVTIGERLRLAIQASCRDANDMAVTISVGCAVAEPGQDPRSAMNEADAALYRAKRAGRNRVEGAGMLDGRAVA